jgi:transposase InsO family protein
VRYTKRLAEAGASVESRGDSYDRAMAEAFNSLRKPSSCATTGRKNVDDLEIAVAEYIDWFNFRRLHGEIGLIPPSTRLCTDPPPSPSSLLGGSSMCPINPAFDTERTPR